MTHTSQLLVPGPPVDAPPASSGVREDERRQLERVRAELVREFAGRLGEEEVQRRFAATVAAFEGAPIRSFVPVLAQRRVRLELREVGSTATPTTGSTADSPASG